MKGISIIATIDQTEHIAEAIAKRLKAGDVLCLTGDLGAGKTTFSQFLCRALGVDDYVTSPTFNIMNQYDGKLPIYHFDVYRIGDESEMDEIGFDEFLYGNGVCLVEWANMVTSSIPEEAIWLVFSFIDLETRKIEIIDPSNKLGGLLDEISCN